MKAFRMVSLPVLAAGLAAALALGGCAQWRKAPEAAPLAVKQAAPALGPDGKPLPVLDGVAIERVAFRVGVSSATVEQLARATAQCSSRMGAALVSEPGPVEIYRVACDNGQTFMARCELRQCTRYPR